MDWILNPNLRICLFSETRLEANFRSVGGSGLQNPYGWGVKTTVEILEDCAAIAEVTGRFAFQYVFATKLCDTGSLNYLGHPLVSNNNSTAGIFLRHNSMDTTCKHQMTII